jgi:altronate hydrolase
MNPFIRLHPRRRRPDCPQPTRGRHQRRIHQTVKGLIPAGHKIATHAIGVGEPVRRYNQIIGFASKPIAAGEHVHTHNLGDGRQRGDFARDYAFGADVKARARGAKPPSWASGAATAAWPRATTSACCPGQLLGHGSARIADHFSRQTNPEALADYPTSTAWWP